MACQIDRGDTTFNGGAILVTRGASLNLYYSEVSGNKADYGGGIYVDFGGGQGAVKTRWLFMVVY